MKLRIFSFVFFVVTLCTAVPAHAAETDMNVAGWIPYWSVKTGTRDAMKNLDKLDGVYPFVFTVKQDGSLKDNGKLESREWQKLFKAARAKNIEIIPTVMSGDGALMHAIFADPEKRKHHIKELVKVVRDGKFDGIDVDYEGKPADSMKNFSTFLTELKKELGSKKLVCTIEPRTPPDSLYKEIPNPLKYSNDYAVIGEVCDVIQIMTYDQQRADIKLNSARVGQPYYPVSDPEWVEKVAQLAISQLPKEKIMLGAPTYGRHVALTVAPEWFQNYQGISAINHNTALALAKKHRAKPSTNSAGEQVFTYLPKETRNDLSKKILSTKVSATTTPGMKVAMQALAYATKSGETVTVNMAWWSDAAAIKNKIDLAKKYNLRGVAIFKIDGNEDPLMWNLFQ